MYRADYADESWKDGKLLPYGNIEIDPAAKVLHYAQEVFEEPKLIKLVKTLPIFSRPLENLNRINLSSKRMCMIDIPQNIWMDGISLMTAYSEPFIPNESEILCIFAFLIGTKSNLGMGVSDTFTFIVIS